MKNPLLKFTALLVLIFALTFLAGVTPSAVALSGTVPADLCCGGDAEQNPPVTGDDCADPDCRCLSCSVAILNISPSLEGTSREPSSLCCVPPAVLPSDYISSIDYPPESA